MILDKQALLQQLYILYIETAPFNQEKEDAYDKIMRIVKIIAPDDMFVIDFEIKLMQYYSAGEKDGFYGGFDILKRLTK